jgi:hypothetical protein
MATTKSIGVWMAVFGLAAVAGVPAHAQFGGSTSVGGGAGTIGGGIGGVGGIGGLGGFGGLGNYNVTLPKSDFSWTWGDREDAVTARFPDFTLKGGEGGFVCDLNGKLALGRNWSLGDVRELKNAIAENGFFIQASANAMSTLDFQRELQWARLDCEKPKETGEQVAKRKESLQKLHDKEVQKLIERREKREKEAAEGEAED